MWQVRLGMRCVAQTDCLPVKQLLLAELKKKKSDMRKIVAEDTAFFIII